MIFSLNSSIFTLSSVPAKHLLVTSDFEVVTEILKGEGRSEARICCVIISYRYRYHWTQLHYEVCAVNSHSLCMRFNFVFTHHQSKFLPVSHILCRLTDTCKEYCY